MKTTQTLTEVPARKKVEPVWAQLEMGSGGDVLSELGEACLCPAATVLCFGSHGKSPANKLPNLERLWGSDQLLLMPKHAGSTSG